MLERDQGDGFRCIYLFFVACTDCFFAEFYRVDDLSYAGMVCSIGAWHGDSCHDRSILAAEICVY